MGDGMLTPQFLLPIHTDLVVDLFAGGGGASTGIEQLELGLMKFRTRVQTTEAMLRRPVAANFDQIKAAA